MITFYFRKEKQKVYPNYTLFSIGDAYYFLFLNVENSNSFYIYIYIYIYTYIIQDFLEVYIENVMDLKID